MKPSLSRRAFLIGAVAVVAVAAIPAMALDDRIFIRWQTWPKGSKRPEGEHAYGTGSLGHLREMAPRWRAMGLPIVHVERIA